MLVYRGETRFLSVQHAAVLAEGDSLTGTPTVVVSLKRGRVATTLVVVLPAAPTVDGTSVTFWVETDEDTAKGNYLAKVTCATANGETVVEEAPLLVQ